MDKIKAILLEQLRRHSTGYLESKKRGIVVDDLDVDAFIEEASALVKETLCKQCAVSKNNIN